MRHPAVHKNKNKANITMPSIPKITMNTSSVILRQSEYDSLRTIDEGIFYLISDGSEVKKIYRGRTEIKVGGGAEVIGTSYSELKSMRDAKKLEVGRSYRIENYKCTTTQVDTTCSPESKTFIVATAVDVDKLSEEVRLEDGTGGYPNMSRWKAWYCIDNDSNRFLWADSQNGRGVIYRMIDEWGNDIPFDYIHMKFKVDSTYVSVFSDSNDLSSNNDCKNNVIKPCYESHGLQRLNSIVMMRDCLNNKFGEDCHDIHMGAHNRDNRFGNSCHDIVFGESVSRPQDFVRHCKFESGLHGIYFYTTVTTDSSNYLQNCIIDQGVSCDVAGEYTTCEADAVNQDYLTYFKVTADVVNFCIPPQPSYLTFTAGEDNSTITLNMPGTRDQVFNVEYSIDEGQTWNSYSSETITLDHIGDTVKFRGMNDTMSGCQFSMSGSIAGSGDMNTLLNLFGGDVTLSDKCYSSIFQDCTSLTQAPELPTTNLIQNCYNSMFSGCTALTQGPELPATTLANGCYGGMFNGCTNLENAPELPATTLTEYCYAGMFSGCTSLTQAPDLPATTLANGCYGGMFSGCTSLTQAPELPATTLTEYCYSGMFNGCKALTQAPELSATTLANSCYGGMFNGCTNLNYIKAMFTTTPSDYYTRNWVQGVAAEGTFVKNLDADWDVNGDHGIPLGWNINYSVIPEVLTFTANTAGSTIELRKDGSPYEAQVEYSIDSGETYNEYVFGNVITLTNKGDSVKFRGNNDKFNKDYNNIYNFHMSGSISGSGDVTSLLNMIGGDVDLTNKNYCFGKLFDYYSGALKNSPRLPSTILAPNCYSYMFSRCSSLEVAPKLPAMILASSCYSGMFESCSSLTVAPELPATTLANYCYQNMFNSGRIKRAPILPATTLAIGCYDNMFAYSRIEYPSELPATTLTEYCYQDMFRDSWLTQAPELPATILAKYCYRRMFLNTKIITAPALPATTLTEECYYAMFNQCNELTQAPDLPATTLVSGCYQYMFSQCTLLNYIKALFTTTPNNSYTQNWVNGVASTGTFVKNSAATWNVTGTNGIPSGWTVQTASE